MYSIQRACHEPRPLFTHTHTLPQFLSIRVETYKYSVIDTIITMLMFFWAGTAHTTGQLLPMLIWLGCVTGLHTLRLRSGLSVGCKNRVSRVRTHIHFYCYLEHFSLFQCNTIFNLARLVKQPLTPLLPYKILRNRLI